MTDYSGVTWRVNYGEISEREQFRVGYVGQDSFDAYFEVAALGELLSILTTVQGLGIGQMATGTTLQARKVDAGHLTEVVIEPRSDKFPQQIMRLELSTTPDLVYALQLFQTDLPDDPEPDDWDNTDSFLLDRNKQKIKEKLLPDRLSDEALHDEFAGAVDLTALEDQVDDVQGAVGDLDTALGVVTTDVNGLNTLTTSGRLSDAAIGTKITAQTQPAARNPITNVSYARDFGFSTTNTAAQNRSALIVAMSAVSRGDTIILPTGSFACDPLLITRNVTIKGTPPSISVQYLFGDVRWANAVATGTVLRFPNTTGNAIEIQGDTTITNGVVLQDFAMIGPGSGSSVGIYAGKAGGLGYPVRLRFHNVQIANFQTGFRSNAENSVFNEMYVVGGEIGVDGFYPFNGNVFVGLNVESCSVHAVRLIDCDTNLFLGGVLQGNTGEKVVYIEGVRSNVRFLNFYLENRNPVKTYEVWIESGISNVFDGIHFGSNPIYNPAVHVGGSRNIVKGDNPPMDVEVAGSDNFVFLNTCSGKVVTNTGLRNIIKTQHSEFSEFETTKVVTASYTVVVADQLVRADGAGIQITLPSPVSLANGGNPGKVWKIGTRASSCTLITNGVALVNGAAATVGTPVTIPPWTVRRYVHDGTNWEQV